MNLVPISIKQIKKCRSLALDLRAHKSLLLDKAIQSFISQNFRYDIFVRDQSEQAAIQRKVDRFAKDDVMARWDSRVFIQM